MKTNAIISALCVVGIIGALCSNGEENRSVIDMKGPGKTDDPGTEQNEGLTALPVQKVVYWRDIPGMKWDWGTQVTNAPGFLASESDPTVGWTNGTLYVHGDTIDPVQYQQDYSVILPKLIASSGSDGAELNSVGFVQGAGVTIPTGAGIYSAVLGLNAVSTNQFAFVYSGRGENQYYSHGGGTFNIDPVGGASGFWIGETNLQSYVSSSVANKVNQGSNYKMTIGDDGAVTLTPVWKYVFSEPTVNGTSRYPVISDTTATVILNVSATQTSGYPMGTLTISNPSKILATFSIDRQGTSPSSLYAASAEKIDSDFRSTTFYQEISVNGFYVSGSEASSKIVLNDSFRTPCWNFTSGPGPTMTLATTSTTNGLASTVWVNAHQWDWTTQVTNKPNFVTTETDPTIGLTNGTIYVHGSTLTPLSASALDGYVATNHSGNVDIHGTVRLSYESGATPSLAIGNAGDYVYANSSASLALGANSIVENCYGGMALGIYTHTTNQFAFVYGGDYMSGKYYGDHGGGTFNVNPLGGLSGFWIGETNLATYLANAGGPYEHEHDHLTSLNNEWKLVQLNGGKAVIMPAYYSGSQSGIEVKFSPAVPMEEVWYMQTNALLTAPASADFYMNGQHAAHGDGYVTGGTQFDMTNKVIKISSFHLQDSLPISYPSSATAPLPGTAFNQSPPSSFTFAGQIEIPITPMQTLVSAEYIASKLEGVNVNLQSAEDTRVALTNLITILKNL